MDVAEEQTDPAGRRSTERITRLQAVTAAFSESLTPTEVAQVAVEQGMEALEASAGSIVLLTADGQALESVRAIGYSENLSAPLLDAVRTGVAVYLEQDGEAWAALPLLVEGHAVGGLGFTFRPKRRFDAEDRAFMQTFARQCAQALERARLYEEAQAAERRLQFLVSASELLVTSLDYETTLVNLVRLVVPEFADWCAVDMLAPDGETLERLAVEHLGSATGELAEEIQRRYPPDPNEPGSIFHVLRTGETAFYPEIPDDYLIALARDEEALRLLREIGLTSAVIVPLRARGSILGTLTFVTLAESGRHYTAEDRDFLQELADRAAVSIDNARLYRLAERERNRATAILSSIQDGFYSLDQEWRFTYLNEYSERYFGHSREELLGRSLWTSFPAAVDSSAFTKFHQAVREGVPVHFEIFSPFSRVWIEVHAYPSSEGLSVNFRDITARKRAEEELRYITTHARCLLWEGTVSYPHTVPDQLNWETDIVDEAAAHAFFPLDCLPGEKYTAAWYRHRLPEGRALTDVVSREALFGNRPEYQTEFGCVSLYAEVRWFSERVYVEPLPSVFANDQEYQRWRVVGVCVDLTERKRTEEERLRFARERDEGIRQQRAFLRDVLFSVTEGKLRLCDSAAALPERLTPVAAPIPLAHRTLRLLRLQAESAVMQQDFPRERWHDLETAIGEAGMNAVVHAGGGVGVACLDATGNLIQIWIEDRGKGIAMDQLPQATLERGYTTAGTFGHGFWMILKTVDRVWLMTGPEGTTVVLEMERMPPQPRWLLWNMDKLK